MSVMCKCQFCGKVESLSTVLNLGYMPPPNDMLLVGSPFQPQTWLPTTLMWCSECELAQLGYVPDQTVAFPPDYPYTSGATPALRKNFEDLASKCSQYLKADDLVVDIGANDGTLLDSFTNYRTLGVEPTNVGHFAKHNMVHRFFNKITASRIALVSGKAKLITCTNCFAHMPDIHDVVEGIKLLLDDDGMFVSESHYLVDLISTLQYDTIYAEHLRYYTVRSIAKLLGLHGLYVNRVERIPTHGGSIRVYASKHGQAHDHTGVFDSAEEHDLFAKLNKFAKQVQRNKLSMLRHLELIKSIGARVVGFAAPSRGSTVINYLGLDASIVDFVVEQSHSLKLGRYMPGTDIPVVDESKLYNDPTITSVILFSWHLADELIPKIRAKGFQGEIILPCSATIVNAPPTTGYYKIPPGGGAIVGGM